MAAMQNPTGTILQVGARQGSEGELSENSDALISVKRVLPRLKIDVRQGIARA
jgi:hypothetical protein